MCLLVLEIAQDAGRLRQYEAELMKVCGHIELFVPAEELKVKCMNNVLGYPY